MQELWTTTTTRLGDETADFIEAGVLILFAEPVPDALADVSIVHEGASELARPLSAGDRLQVGGDEYLIDAVGERACQNLTDLGHIVIYVNQPDQELLPGAVLATGPDLSSPEIGSQIKFLGE